MRRSVSWAVALAGAIVAVAPFSSWFRVDLPTRNIGVAGVDAAGELWILPVIGIGITVCGALLVQMGKVPHERSRRWVGIALVVLGAAGLVASLIALLATSTVAVPLIDGDRPVTPLRTAPLGWVGAAATAAIVAIGCALLRPATATDDRVRR